MKLCQNLVNGRDQFCARSHHNWVITVISDIGYWPCSCLGLCRGLTLGLGEHDNSARTIRRATIQCGQFGQLSQTQNFATNTTWPIVLVDFVPGLITIEQSLLQLVDNFVQGHWAILETSRVPEQLIFSHLCCDWWIVKKLCQNLVNGLDQFCARSHSKWAIMQ